MLTDAVSIKHIAGELERSGYVVIQQYLGARACTALATECRALDASGFMRAAAVGRTQTRRQQTDVRGDRTRWFDAGELTSAQAPYWAAMEGLRVGLNRSLLLGLDEFEAHYAVYAPRTRYARHRDRFRDDDARVLSSVLYLNADWQEHEGGALRLYLPPPAADPHVDIYPENGKLVLFLSAEFEHEVLPATRDRLSIAGWFRRRSGW